MKKILVLCLSTLSLVYVSPGVAQEALVGGATEQSKVDQQENQIVEKFEDAAVDMEQKLGEAFKGEVKKDSQLIKETKTFDPAKSFFQDSNKNLDAVEKSDSDNQ